MELPAGMDLEGKSGSSSACVLKLNKSLYGLKRGSLNWHNKLKDAWTVAQIGELVARKGGLVSSLK